MILYITLYFTILLNFLNFLMQLINSSRCKMGIPGQVALNDPAQNPRLGNALNDPTPGKRVHSMTPSLKKISPRHKKIENQFKEI